MYTRQEYIDGHILWVKWRGYFWLFKGLTMEVNEEFRTFKDLGICEPLSEACDKLGWKNAAKIQAQVIPHALQGFLFHSVKKVWHINCLFCCFSKTDYLAGIFVWNNISGHYIYIYIYNLAVVGIGTSRGCVNLIYVIGKDVIALAQTGSGKTGAFALPILQALLDASQPFFACVLSPTRFNFVS